MHKLVLTAMSLLLAGVAVAQTTDGQRQGAASDAATGARNLAQAPVDKAWTVLQAGLANKTAGERAAAVRVLGLLENDQKAQELALKALNDHKPEVRTAAADALGQMQAKSAAPQLGQIITGDEKDVGVVLACARSMIELGDNRGYGVYYAILTGEKKKGGALRDTQKQMLRQVFQDPKKMAVGFLPFGGVAYDTFQSFHRDDESPVKAAAAKVLAKDPDSKSEAALLTATSDKSWAVRTAALDSLARRDDRKVIPQIESKLNDKKHVVRYTAVGAIIRLNKPEVGLVGPTTNKPQRETSN